MDDLLAYGVEELGDMLKESPNTRAAFKSITEIVKEISEVIKTRSMRALGGLRKSCISVLR